MMTKYPLTWPHAWPRTPEADRADSKFKRQGRSYGANGTSWATTKSLTVSDATKRLTAELGRLKVGEDDFIISTNLQVRMDGLPRSGQRRPDDPGAAVYWKEKSGRDMAIAIDKYHKVEDNIAAIAATIEALRGIERWGGAQIIERAFTGFAALEGPAPADPWYDVLGLPHDATEAEIERQYRKLRKDEHPDHGGTDEGFIAVKSAYETAKRERGYA